MPHRLSRTALSRLAQWFFFLAGLYVGWRFVLFCRFAVGAGPQVARPAGVEGFLPISALLGLRHALATHTWDPVHPAGLSILLAALAMGLVFRKAFCGHVCPVGFVATRLGRLGQRLGLARSVPAGPEAGLRLPKYLLLAFFLYTALFGMGPAEIEAFLRSSYNITADARMLLFFAQPRLRGPGRAGRPHRTRPPFPGLVLSVAVPLRRVARASGQDRPHGPCPRRRRLHGLRPLPPGLSGGPAPDRRAPSPRMQRLRFLRRGLPQAPKRRAVHLRRVGRAVVAPDGRGHGRVPPGLRPGRRVRLLGRRPARRHAGPAVRHGPRRLGARPRKRGGNVWGYAPDRGGFS